MTAKQIEIVNIHRANGYGYKKIASLTGISPNTIKSYIRTHPAETVIHSICLNCGLTLQQTPHKRKKKFCSDKCRLSWWSSHPEMRKNGKGYVHRCIHCGIGFSSSRPDSKYCSTICFANARRNGAAV